MQKLRDFAKYAEGDPETRTSITRYEVSKILELIDRMTGDLTGMVAQNCTCDGGVLDSMAISDNADAMNLLGELGLLNIISSRGRRVIGRWPEPV